MKDRYRYNNNDAASRAQRSACSLQWRIDYQTRIDSNIQSHQLTPHAQQNRLPPICDRHGCFGEPKQSSHLRYFTRHLDFLYQRDVYDF